MLGLSRRWWPGAALLGVAIVAGALLLATSLLQRTTPPLALASEPPASSSPTAEPTAAPPATLDLKWTETAAFGDESAMEVLDVTSWAHGIVAVGARYLGQVPSSGALPPTVSGAIWLSTDGRSWDEVTPPDVFGQVRLHEVYEAGDGSLIVVGETWRQGQAWPREGEPVAQFWRSVDGASWQEIRNLLPAQRYVGAIERGPLGYVLLGHILKRGENGKLFFWETEIWFSPDGIDWELARSSSVDEPYRQYIWDVGAGKDGFVAVGRTDAGMSGESFTIASRNGRDWVPAAAPPEAFGWQVAAPPEGGWVVVGYGTGSDGGVYLESFEEPGTTVWASSSGIDWHQVSTMEFRSVDLDGQTMCDESLADVESDGGWLVASTRLSCTVGDTGVEGFGTPRISLDGADWQPVPIPELSLDPTTRVRNESGLVIRAAIASEVGLVLAGQSNGQATFWLGVPR